MKECYKSSYIFGGTVILILTNWIYLNYITEKDKNIAENDFLNYKILSIPNQSCCSGWSLTHFILFFILGILYPRCDIFILGAGVLWEIFESTIFPLLNRKLTRREKNGKIQYHDWWAGSFWDIIVNTIGYYMGKLLYIYILKPKGF